MHDLARASVGRENDVAAIDTATATVEQATAALGGPRLENWWEGPAVPVEDRGIRAFARRSPFQGELHPFSSTFDWHEVAGPDGQPAWGFDVQLDRLFGGPPNSVHGGYIAGLFDELLGAVQSRASGGGGFTGRLEIRYRALTPLDTPLTFTGWISQEQGRRIQTVGHCRAGETLCAEAVGLFVRPAAGLRG